MNMNYSNTCARSPLEVRLREIDAMRAAEERLYGPSIRGASSSGALLSVGLALTLGGIALLCAAMLTQDFTGKYKGYSRPVATSAHQSMAIPNIGQ